MNINHLGAGTIKILLFLCYFIVVFTAELPYLWYRQKDPKNARMDCTTGVYDKFVNEGIETILDRLGIKSDKPLTRKEKLLAFIGFKAGLMWERLAEIQTKPASPDPIEMVIMGILKNGKKC